MVSELIYLKSFMDGQWDKVEDKFAVTTLATAGALALWSSAGMISVSYFITCSLILSSNLPSNQMVNYGVSDIWFSLTGY